MSPVDLREHAPTADSAARPGRILALDLARGAALVAMAVYHFVYDLELFGFVPQATSVTGGWRLLAILTAGSFLYLAGVSLWLAQGYGRNWRGFWRRFAKIAGAAALVTVATWAVMPQAFVFFGILHAIAASSLVGLLVLRLPAVALVALAAAAFAAPGVLRSELFDPWWLWWTGLQRVPVVAVDYVPLVPWVAPFLLGLATGRAGAAAGVWHRLSQWRGNAGLERLAWPGRHSLAVYLLHQPVLIALVGAASLVLR
jgi:uncharacterized membrane protein